VLVVVVLAVTLVVLGCVLPTAAGARRRGAGVPLAALAGLVFPVTWTVWYLHDERPYRRTPA